MWRCAHALRRCAHALWRCAHALWRSAHALLWWANIVGTGHVARLLWWANVAGTGHVAHLLWWANVVGAGGVARLRRWANVWYGDVARLLWWANIGIGWDDSVVEAGHVEIALGIGDSAVIVQASIPTRRWPSGILRRYAVPVGELPVGGWPSLLIRAAALHLPALRGPHGAAPRLFAVLRASSGIFLPKWRRHRRHRRNWRVDRRGSRPSPWWHSLIEEWPFVVERRPFLRARPPTGRPRLRSKTVHAIASIGHPPKALKAACLRVACIAHSSGGTRKVSAIGAAIH